jgi:hypothetical protein
MTNSLLNRSGVFVAKNLSGAAAPWGTVGILGGGEERGFTTIGSAGYKDSSVVVVMEPNGIADDAYGMVAMAVTVPKVLLDAEADLLDFVKLSGSAGLGTPHAGPPAAGDFAQVLDAGGEPPAVLFGFPVQSDGSGATPLKTIWDPDAPPASASALDDEFDDGTLDAKWTELDFGSVLAVNESGTYNHLILTSSPGAGNKAAGLAQTLPAGDFTIVAKVGLRAISANAFEAGIALWQNLTSGSDIKTLSAQMESDGFVDVRSVEYSDYLNPVGIEDWSHEAVVGPHAVYLRLRRNGSNYYQDWSLDGLHWNTHGAATNPSFTPGYCGVFANNTPASGIRESSFHFFRYTGSDVGERGILAGQLRGIYA